MIAIKRPIFWFAALPAAAFFVGSCSFLAYAFVINDGWKIAYAMAPGLPWTFLVRLPAESLAPLGVQCVASYAANSALLFLALAGVVRGAQNLRLWLSKSN